METQKNEQPKMDEHCKCGGHHWHHGMRGYGGWWIAKLIILLLLLGLVFHLGSWSGRYRAYYRGYGYDGYGMMRPYGMMGMMGGYWNGPAFGRGSVWSNPDSKSIFGTIRKIEGNMVTVRDNAGRETAVITISSTAIYTASGPISLSQLKPGWNIMAEGVMKGNKLEASVIQAY